MDEKYPDHRTGGKDQDIYAERAVVRGQVADQAQAGAEPPPADAPLTGDARVDAAVAGLSRLAGTPPRDHVAVLEEVHGRLRDILGELAEGQR